MDEVQGVKGVVILFASQHSRSSSKPRPAELHEGVDQSSLGLLRMLDGFCSINFSNQSSVTQRLV